MFLLLLGHDSPSSLPGVEYVSQDLVDVGLLGVC